ncbi:hypothetical protein NE234_38280 [Actinoallomurus sp. WRP9H-5]|nr:hypothetical protein [Actinoallomurus rhizosphaericola]
MRHRAIKIVHVVIFAASTMLAFLVLEDLDSEPTLGETATIWIMKTHGSVNGAETARMVTSFARAHHISIVRKVDDFRDPGRLTHLYIAAGEPGSAPAFWLKHGYSPFGHGLRVRTHALEQIGYPDPRGLYHVYGSHDGVEALRAEFARSGLTGDLIYRPGLGDQIHRHSRPPLTSAFYVIAISVVLTVGASVLMSAKGYGVLRLHGMSFLTIIRRDLRRLAFFWSIAAVGVTAVTLIFLGLYNGFARLGLFALIAGGLAGALSILAVIAHTGALALVTRAGILRGLKGEVAAGPAMAGAYLVRIAAALLIFVIGGAALVSWQDVTRREASRTRFASLGGATYIALAGSRTPDAAEIMSHQVGRWLRRADSRGQIIADYRWPLEQLAPPAAGLPEGDLLLVNDTFLADQPIVGPSGGRYGADPRGRVRVIVPEKFREHAGDITENVPAQISPVDGGERVRRAGVDQVWARDGQTVFTFNAGDDDNAEQDRSLVHDPVLIVVPNGSHLISDGAYTAMATHDGIIFKNPQDVLAAIGREVPKEDITELTPVAQHAAARYAQAARRLRINALSLSMAVTVLFITGIGVCTIYAQKNAQAIFAKHVSGWSFWATHRRLFLLDALVAGGLVAWAGWEIRGRIETLREFTDRGVPPPPNLPPADWWELAPATGVALLATALLVAALSFAHHRVVKEHAADA